MPVQRSPFTFKDISGSFESNPISGDLIALKNNNAIARSIRNLILTNRGERPFQPNLGSDVNSYLFMDVNNVNAAVIEESIASCINRYEPRVKLLEINVTAEEENNAYYVDLVYQVSGVDEPTTELSFALQSNR